MINFLKYDDFIFESNISNVINKIGSQLVLIDPFWPIME